MIERAYVQIPKLGTVELGPMADNERNLVVATWAHSHRLEHTRMPKSAYFAWQRERIDRVLERPVLALVARDAECNGLAYGYVVAERLGPVVALHWVHCKEGYRRQGVGNALLAEALVRIGADAREVVYTHKSRFDGKAKAMGMRHVPLEQVLRAEREVA